MEHARDRVIVALDISADDTLSISAKLRNRAKWLKVGMTLFYSAGPAIVGRLRSEGFDVFCDLKLHDIPHQVSGAARELAALGVGMLTVHASGGPGMVAAAVEGASAGASRCGLPTPAVLAVTVLTSMDSASLVATGVEVPAERQVVRLTEMALEAGAHGVVCSPLEAAAVRSVAGGDALVVTPGVRSAGGEVGDQVRVATPREAIAAGASHIVVGRPITGASDPAVALEAVVQEVGS